MSEPAYVSIAGDLAARIRSGELRPGTQLPSNAELVQTHGVSNIVIRRSISLLQSQGLVRTVRRRGAFVAERPTLVRVSPERQMESPEATYRNESSHEIQVNRESNRVQPTAALAEIFGITDDREITHVITRATEDGQPVSISDTYQPCDIDDVSDAVVLEETIRDTLPSSLHAEWLGTGPSDLVKTVHQRFMTSDNTVVMVSDISYPPARYEAFLFRMDLNRDSD